MKPRTGTSQRKFREQLATRARELEAQGKIAPKYLPHPGRFSQRAHPTWPLHRVANRQDGIAIDQYEAEVTFADQWWAPHAHYLGSSRGWHTFERPPDTERRL